VAYSYATGRGGEHAVKLIDGFNGIFQFDECAAYKKLAASSFTVGLPPASAD